MNEREMDMIQTMKKIDEQLTAMEDGLKDRIYGKLMNIQTILKGVEKMEQTKTIGERIEIERWIEQERVADRHRWLLLVILFSIIMCVLFAGVIAFCRQSNRGAITFSGISIVIFVLSWILSALLVPSVIVSVFVMHTLLESHSPMCANTVIISSTLNSMPISSRHSTSTNTVKQHLHTTTYHRYTRREMWVVSWVSSKNERQTWIHGWQRHSTILQRYISECDW